MGPEKLLLLVPETPATGSIAGLSQSLLFEAVLPYGLVASGGCSQTGIRHATGNRVTPGSSPGTRLPH